MDNIYQKSKKINKDKYVGKILEGLMKDKAKIIDDFCKLYISGRNLTTEQIKRLELVEEQTGSGFIYSFRLKRGKLNY